MDTQLSTQSDDELIALCAKGNGAAFEELVLRYKNSLYQYIQAMVKDEGAAGDLFQEVFLALFKQADRFKHQGKVKAWLFLTARNKVFNYQRDHKYETSLDVQDEQGNEFLHDTLPDEELPQLDRLMSQEGARQIYEVLATLPPSQREVIYLRQYLSFKEIAQLLKKPLGTVLADSHRALQKVRKQLICLQEEII